MNSYGSSYGSRFGSSRIAPGCFGRQYDSNDTECRSECPFREDCYKEWRKSYYSEARPAQAASTTTATGTIRQEVQVREVSPRQQVELLPNVNDILPYEGEPWYERLWWNSFSAALSAMGRETHLFFQVYRFPPKEHVYLSERQLPAKAEERRPAVDEKTGTEQTRRGEGGR